MEIKKLAGKLPEWIKKYKFAVAVLIIGLILLLIPGEESQPQNADATATTPTKQETLSQESLSQILQSIEGAGKVKVLLSVGAGEETVYQTDADASSSADSSNQSAKTVIITDSQRNEAGLIRQVNPAVYQGAIIVCQGADSPAVRLAVTQAVSKITGLGTDAICVLKMQ